MKEVFFVSPGPGTPGYLFFPKIVLHEFLQQLRLFEYIRDKFLQSYLHLHPVREIQPSILHSLFTYFAPDFNTEI